MSNVGVVSWESQQRERRSEANSRRSENCNVSSLAADISTGTAMPSMSADRVYLETIRHSRI